MTTSHMQSTRAAAPVADEACVEDLPRDERTNVGGALLKDVAEVLGVDPETLRPR